MHLYTIFSVLAPLALTLVSAEHHRHKRNHAAIDVSKREETEELSVFKRDAGAKFTYYQDGLGACGKTNKPSDFIVALNSQQFAGGAHCFEMITITVAGKTSQAMIVDECMGCGYNNLDFSQGLFDFFGLEALGVLQGSWSFGSGNSSPSPSPKPKAKVSPTPSSSSKATSSSTKAKPSSSTGTTSSKTLTPTPTPTPTPTSSSVPPNVDIQTAGAFASQEANASNIYALNMAFMGLSDLIASA